MRGLQATTVVHRVAVRLRLLRLLRPSAAGAAPVVDAGVGLHGGLPTRDGLLAVLARARSAGVPADAVTALAHAWPDLAPAVRRGVARPLRDGRPGPLQVAGVPARQADATTCGSAVLAMLAAAGDPALALWLVTGRLLPGYLPPELRTVPGAQVTSPDAAIRLAGLQRALKRASTRGGLGPLPWPAALGTPPWGAARAARFGGLRWTHVLVDDTDRGLLDAVLDRADSALAAGVPVPLFTGGDLGGGPAAAVPRHVVMLVPVVPASASAPAGAGDASADRPYAVYEPGHGRVHRVTRRDLVEPSGAHPALGGWGHVCWAVLPVSLPWHGAARGTTMG